MALKAARSTTQGGRLLVRPLGAVGFWGGIAGALSAVVLLFYPPVVPPEQFSYPFNGAGFTIAQIFFALQHVTMMAVILGLLLTPAAGSRLARWGLSAGLTGLVLLAALELSVIPAAHAVSGEPLYGLVQSFFSIPTMLTGIGLAVGGIGVLRHGAWTGMKRFLPLVLGIYVFVPLIPAIMGPHLAGRIGIGVWVLLFGQLGWILWHGDRAEIERTADTLPSVVKQP